MISLKILSILVLINILGLSTANWVKIPYAVNYKANKAHRQMSLINAATTLASQPSSITTPVLINPNTLLSRSGLAGGGVEVTAPQLLRPSHSKFSSRQGWGGGSSYGSYGGGAAQGGGGGWGGNSGGAGGGTIFMLGGNDIGGGGNNIYHDQVQAVEHITIQDYDHGSQYLGGGFGLFGSFGGGGGNNYGGGGGWKPSKKNHVKHEKPGYVQKLIPIAPINGKFSEILNWFSDPHGHRFGFSTPHKGSHGWKK